MDEWLNSCEELMERTLLASSAFPAVKVEALARIQSCKWAVASTSSHKAQMGSLQLPDCCSVHLRFLDSELARQRCNQDNVLAVPAHGLPHAPKTVANLPLCPGQKATHNVQRQQHALEN